GIAFHGRVDADEDRDADPDREREAGKDQRREGRPGDPTDHRLAAVDRDAEVAVKDAVRAAAEKARQEVRHALVADEDAQSLAVRIAHAEPAAVLHRDGLVEAPGLLELLLVLERHPR